MHEAAERIGAELVAAAMEHRKRAPGAEAPTKLRSPRNTTLKVPSLSRSVVSAGEKHQSRSGLGTPGPATLAQERALPGD